MIVTCACCGFEGHITDYEVWTRHGTYPKVWICDICMVDFQ